MAQREPTTDGFATRRSVRDAVGWLRDLGGLLALFSCSLVAGGVAALLTTGTAPGVAVDLALTAFGLSTPDGPVRQVLHVGTLGLVAGTWLVGAGLLVEGLLE